MLNIPFYADCSSLGPPAQHDCASRLNDGIPVHLHKNSLLDAAHRVSIHARYANPKHDSFKLARGFEHVQEEAHSDAWSRNLMIKSVYSF